MTAEVLRLMFGAALAPVVEAEELGTAASAAAQPRIRGAQRRRPRGRATRRACTTVQLRCGRGRDPRHRRHRRQRPEAAGRGPGRPAAGRGRGASCSRAAPSRRSMSAPAASSGCATSPTIGWARARSRRFRSPPTCCSRRSATLPFWRRGARGARPDRRARPRPRRAPSTSAPRAVNTPIGRLSGGNIQKALLARELSGPAKVVIYRQADLWARRARHIWRRAAASGEAAAGGVGTLLISTDLDELLELADRIAVMAHGRLVGIVANDDAARERGRRPDGRRGRMSAEVLEPTARAPALRARARRRAAAPASLLSLGPIAATLAARRRLLLLAFGVEPARLLPAACCDRGLLVALRHPGDA